MLICMRTALNIHEETLKRAVELTGVAEKTALVRMGLEALIACLAEEIGHKEVEPLAQGIVAWLKELAPAGEITCVFRDNAFADDVAKTSVAEILKQHGIEKVRNL